MTYPRPKLKGGKLCDNLIIMADMEGMMTSIMTVMEDVAEEDDHIFNIRFSRTIPSTQFIHHIIAIHTINNHITVDLTDTTKMNKTHVN